MSHSFNDVNSREGSPELGIDTNHVLLEEHIAEIPMELVDHNATADEPSTSAQPAPINKTRKSRSRGQGTKRRKEERHDTVKVVKKCKRMTTQRKKTAATRAVKKQVIDDSKKDQTYTESESDEDYKSTLNRLAKEDKMMDGRSVLIRVIKNLKEIRCNSKNVRYVYWSGLVENLDDEVKVLEEMIDNMSKVDADRNFKLNMNPSFEMVPAERISNVDMTQASAGNLLQKAFDETKKIEKHTCRNTRTVTSIIHPYKPRTMSLERKEQEVRKKTRNSTSAEEEISRTLRRLTLSNEQRFLFLTKQKDAVTFEDVMAFRRKPTEGCKMNEFLLNKIYMKFLLENCKNKWDTGNSIDHQSFFSFNVNIHRDYEKKQMELDRDYVEMKNQVVQQFGEKIRANTAVIRKLIESRKNCHRNANALMDDFSFQPY